MRINGVSHELSVGCIGRWGWEDNEDREREGWLQHGGRSLTAPVGRTGNYQLGHTYHWGRWVLNVREGMENKSRTCGRDEKRMDMTDVSQKQMPPMGKNASVPVRLLSKEMICFMRDLQQGV